VRLTIIGAGPAYTNRRGAAASSYLLEATAAEGGPATLLLDLGQGAFANLAATIEPSGLTAILISHLHPDHFIDLVSLRHYLKWEFAPPRRAAVLAPAGLSERLDALDGSAGFTAEALDVERLAEGQIRLGPFVVEAGRVTHTNESYAFRVSIGSGGTSSGNGHMTAGLVYSGDCARADDFVPLIRPGDTLLSEATSGGRPVPPGARHIAATDAAAAATSGNAARLLLTHILASSSRAETLSAAQSAFAGDIRLVLEGESFEI